MSRLIERLKKANQVAIPRLGFGFTRQEQSRPAGSPPALIALVESRGAGQAEKRLLTSLKESGIDGCILTVSQERDLQKSLDAVDGLPPFPVGIWLRYETSEEGASANGPWDFLVLSASSPSGSLLADEGCKKVLQVAPSMEEGAIRAIEHLPVEAVLLDDGKEQSQNIYGLLTLLRFTQLVRKPLLVKTPATTSQKELQSLRDSGIAGIVVEVSDQVGVDLLKGMRQMLEALPPRQKREERGAAILPQIPTVSQEAHTHAPEEEPDEEEDY